MARTDWIPSREQDFADLVERWISFIQMDANIAAYKWDTDECLALLGKLKAFLAARKAYDADNSSVKRLAKNTSRKEAERAMRDFANSSVRFNKNMDETARLALGVHPRDTTPTLHPRPSSQPGTVVENTKNHYEHRLIALNPDGKTARKPDDAVGVRFAWQIGGEKPAAGAELPKGKFRRTTTFVVEHSEADKGKAAYYATCYENSRGEAGPWSPVEEAFIG